MLLCVDRHAQAFWVQILGRVLLCVDRHAKALWVQILGGVRQEGGVGPMLCGPAKKGACVGPTWPVGPATSGVKGCVLYRGSILGGR